MIILRITLKKDAMFEIAQVLEHQYQWIESDYHRYTDVLHRSTVVGCGIVNEIIGVSRLLFWLAIFRSEDRTNDEYTKITWQLRVISITFDPYPPSQLSAL